MTHLKANTRVAAIPSDQATGPCWARGVAFSLWRGEDYFLQIDSHMRFRPGWDSYLIWQLEMTREDVGRERLDMTNMQEKRYDSSHPFRDEKNLQEKKEILIPILTKSDDLRKHNPHKDEHKHRVAQRNIKPILTTYPLGYHLPDCIPDDIRPTLLVHYTTLRRRSA